ncbi:hypothetical protein DXG03_004353 [Asterophora parasitica]|uniref:CobW/HypB/UreG nucleotide-binding domain-containing protein n=1 Tax=Asterophora parasitica TaxID=117018 RepID=A0A9P7GAS6_9AGAR|nr:hypothetical protein DXG03_004353 [Asterophora parasitica]
MSTQKPIPITVFTGFLGAGKTSVILSLLPQLPKDYKVVLLKNEFGDVEAFPATLAFQIRELERETQGDLKLDAIITVVDAENFAGYEDTSPTAKMQSSYTDIILIVCDMSFPHDSQSHTNDRHPQNKWEHVTERALDFVLDHLNTLNDLTPKIRCDGRKGVDPNLIFGLETQLFIDKASHLHTDASPSHNEEVETVTLYRGSFKGRPHKHVDANCAGCLSAVRVPEQGEEKEEGNVAREDLISALNALSKETVWRVKGFVLLKEGVHILNWAFGRFDLTPLLEPTGEEETIRFTAMGECGEVRRAVRKFCASLGAEVV